jgi:mono/diheme cytochrome c family protein
LTGSLAISAGTGLLLALLGLVVFVGALAYLVTRGGWRTPPAEQEPAVPASMTPGPSDADLDTKILERYQGWGIVLVLFFALWIPLYGIAQPSANQTGQERLKDDSITRGRDIVDYYNEAVNPGGAGCVGCHGVNLEGGTTLFQGETYPVPALNNVCDPSVHPAMKSVEDIRTVIEEGRAGTPMPSWSVKYAGAMDDQQIDDIINYLIEVNIDTVPFDNNVCINPKAGSPTPEPSASASTANAGEEADG